MSRAKQQKRPKTEPENNEPKPLKRGIRRNGLTPRQQRFVSAYLANGLNSSEAARTSGYHGKNANVVGPRMLAAVGVQKAVQERLGKIMGAEFETVKHKVLVELQKEAFDNTSTVIVKDSDGNELYKHNPAKMKALELLAKYAGLLIEKHEHTGKDGGPIQLKWPDAPDEQRLSDNKVGFNG